MRTPRWAAVAAVVAVTACHTQVYPAPGAREIPSTDWAPEGTADNGDAARVRTMESQCRVRLSGETTDASVAALDRVREVLGASCELATVAHDPLHWILRCRSDALFDSGKYELNAAAKQRCPELKPGKVGAWPCVGAVLETLFEGSEGGALEGLELAILGHVDMQPLKAASTSHLCTQLQEELGYAPATPWTPVAEDAPDEERLYANNQLAWCRAASVAHALRSGMKAGEPKAAKQPDPAATTHPMELAILGMGTSWLRSRPQGVCPSHGTAWQERNDCADARRVDILVRFRPSTRAIQSACDDQSPSSEAALYCFQQCMEQAAVSSNTGTGVAPGSAALFQGGAQRPEGLPVGWYLKRLPEDEHRRLDVGRVCSTLAIDAAQCGS